MVPSGYEGDRGTRQGVRDVEGPVLVRGSQRVQSGSEEVRGSSHGLRVTEGQVRV